MADVDYDQIAALTGWNLSNVESVRADLVTLWTNKLDVAGLLASEAQSALASVLASPTLAKATAKIGAAIGPLSTLASVWSGFLQAQQQDMKDTDAANLRRMYEARDASIAATYTTGQWWTLGKVVAPTNPELVKPYKASVASFTGQVSPPGFVFSAARGAGRRDVLRPSWLAPGIDGLEITPDTVYAFGKQQTLVQQLQGLPAFKMKDPSIVNCAGEGEKTCTDLSDKWWGKLQKWVCVPYDVSDGCSVPAYAWWPYCLGAAPTWGWMGQRFPFSPLAQTIAVALRSPSPLHLAVKSSEVLGSLYAICERTGIPDLPEFPGQQAPFGVYRQGCRLILHGDDWKSWSPANKLQEGSLALPVWGLDLAEVIDAHLDFLALRRALVLAMPLQPPELKAAAAASSDPQVKAAAAGQIDPKLYAYNPIDPLNAYTPAPPEDKGKIPKFAWPAAKLAPVPQGNQGQDVFQDPGQGGGGGGGIVVLGGLALAAFLLMRGGR